MQPQTVTVVYSRLKQLLRAKMNPLTDIVRGLSSDGTETVPSVDVGA